MTRNVFTITVAVPVPANLTATAISSSQINLTWSAVTGASGYVIRRSDLAQPLVASHPTNSYSNTGLSADTLYSYTVAAIVNGSAGTASSPASARTATPAPTLYFSDGFESGSFSNWTVNNSMSVVNTNTAYAGTYYARAPTLQNVINNYSVYKDYGTPSVLATQIRDFVCQFAYSFDAFTGSWTDSKVAYWQYYDSSQGTDFGNANRDYQVILKVTSTGRYYVELADIPNFRFIALAQNTANGTTHGPTPNYWDSLRVQVQLDTTGAGNIGIAGVSAGTTAGNGVVRVWKNNTLIIEYTNLNIVVGSTARGQACGMGRMLLTNHHGDSTAWSGSTTAMYWDDFRVVSDVSLLPNMANSPVLRVGTVSNFFAMDYSAAASPAAGWEIEPTISLPQMPSAPVWAYSRQPAGGPIGQPAYDMSILYYPYSSMFYGGQFRWGWFGDLEASDPPRTASRFYRWRMRFDPTSNFRGRDWGDGTGPVGMTNKILLVGDGGTTSRCRVIVEIQTEPFPTTTATDVRSIAIQLDAGTDGVPTGPWPVGQWLNIQVEMKSSSTSSTGNGYFKMWINNNTYSSPNANRTNIVLDPSNWRFVRFGGAQSHGVTSTGIYKWQHSDFRASTQWDPNWNI